MKFYRRTYCNVNGIDIHYERTRGNKRPLILLHGLMTSGACWKGLAEALEKEYDIIMPDARGHGLSSAPDHGYRYEDHGNDVAALIDSLHLSNPILLGHSMGGMTAAVVASHKPNLIGGLILADPSFLDPAFQCEVYQSDVAEQHRRVLGLSFEEVVAEARGRHPNRSVEVLELFAKARLQTSMAAFEVLKPPHPDYRQLVTRIDVPTLLVFGDRGVISPTVAMELQQLNSLFRTEQIGEAGHSLHIDQPEAFAAAVREFLTSLDL